MPKADMKPETKNALRIPSTNASTTTVPASLRNPINRSERIFEGIAVAATAPITAKLID